jgi:predicted nucleic acid-binding protein
MSKSYVLDASAVLDFVEDGPGGKRVEQLFKDALLRRARVLMSVLNWGEVFYHSWQQSGEESARRLLADLSRLPLELVPVDLSQSLQAGEIKARHKIPYVDCIAAGLAILHQAVLVSSDRDFEKLGRRVEVLWIERPGHSN